jgi:hypothetical protein
MSDPIFTRRDFLQTASKAAGITWVGASAVLLDAPDVQAQADTGLVEPVLKQQIQPANVAEFQLRQYLMKKVAPLPSPSSADQWTAEAKRLRKHALDEIVFQGWPKDWVDAPPRFEDLGTIESARGYRTRKLRYEIVPGFQSTGLLYEPEKVTGKAPATLNLNGHSPQGKAAEYKQKRCINNALQGMFALSLEWLGMGELNLAENAHWYGAHLNLVGACATGLFYLAMRKGVDYLCQHPSIDSARIGVTGLSGGGWQTIFLSALDERVAVSIPVSGYFALRSAIERNSDVGDIEYNTPDLRANCDVTVLTAMRAPRPTLLIYAAEDEYGMRAPLEKPHLYDEVKPFFNLYGKEDAFAWHENTDPGTHNYQLDNRLQSYAFFAKHFNLPAVNREMSVDDQIKSCEELVVGLPNDNLTIAGLARKLASGIKHSLIPKSGASRDEWVRSGRERLNNILRFKFLSVKHAWPVSSTRTKGIASVSYRLEFSNELSATAVWLKGTAVAEDAPMVVVLNDEGFQTVRVEIATPMHAPMLSECRANSVAWHINRGQQVLALNLVFIGDASPDQFGGPKSLWQPSALYAELLTSVGDRPLGIQVGQLLGATKWLEQEKGVYSVSIETTGMRSQIAALSACALQPTTYSELFVREGIRDFKYLLSKPISYQDAPELFCPDLYKEFSIEHLAALVTPTKLTETAMID